MCCYLQNLRSRLYQVNLEYCGIHQVFWVQSMPPPAVLVVGQSVTTLHARAIALLRDSLPTLRKCR